MKDGWKECLGYQGSPDCYIFSFYPKFEIYYSHKGQGGVNFAYLNTRQIAKSEYKPGMGIHFEKLFIIGFGGDDRFQNFRIWID